MGITIEKLSELPFLIMETDMLDEQIKYYKEWSGTIGINDPQTIALCDELSELLTIRRKQIIAKINLYAECIRAAPDPLLREIMTLRFFDGLSWISVGIKMKMTDKSISKQVYRYLKKYNAATDNPD